MPRPKVLTKRFINNNVISYICVYLKVYIFMRFCIFSLWYIRFVYLFNLKYCIIGETTMVNIHFGMENAVQNVAKQIYVRKAIAALKPKLAKPNFCQRVTLYFAFRFKQILFIWLYQHHQYHFRCFF
jgi:hypothetical protein